MKAFRLLVPLVLAGPLHAHPLPIPETMEAPGGPHAPPALPEAVAHTVMTAFAKKAPPFYLPESSAEAIELALSYAVPGPSFPTNESLTNAPAARWDGAREKGPPPSLESLLGTRAIRDVFDADTGLAAFQREIREKAWLAPGASISGCDLEQPMYGVDKSLHWRGLTVATSEADPRYPRPESVHLLHLAFMEMTFYSGWRQRLKKFQALVKPGGYLMLSHSNDYKYIDGDHAFNFKVSHKPAEEHLLGRFWEKEWALLARFRGEHPVDYPKTYWWDYFDNHYFEGMKMRSRNFLLLLQRKAQP